MQIKTHWYKIVHTPLWNVIRGMVVVTISQLRRGVGYFPMIICRLPLAMQLRIRLVLQPTGIADIKSYAKDLKLLSFLHPLVFRIAQLAIHWLLEKRLRSISSKKKYNSCNSSLCNRGFENSYTFNEKFCWGVKTMPKLILVQN